MIAIIAHRPPAAIAAKAAPIPLTINSNTATKNAIMNPRISHPNGKHMHKSTTQRSMIKKFFICLFD